MFSVFVAFFLFSTCLHECFCILGPVLLTVTRCAFALVMLMLKYHLVRVRKKNRVWLKIAILVTTITDGDGLTSHVKHPALTPQKRLEMSASVLKNIQLCEFNYSLPFGSLVGFVITPPPSPPPPVMKGG